MYLRKCSVTSCLLVVAMMVLASGCSDDGPARGTVTGTIKFDGEPLAGAEVEFQPETGVPSYGTTDESGVYELAHTGSAMGAELGKHTVRITYQAVDENGDAVESDITLPEKYNSNSELTVEVVSGGNVHDFDLVSN